MKPIAECRCPSNISFLQHGEHIMCSGEEKDGCGFEPCKNYVSGDCNWPGWNEVLNTKPTCQLTRNDGNVFAVIGKVSATLKQADQRDKANEFKNKSLGCSSYDEVLRLCMEYVEVR